MTTVLIAVDETEESVEAAALARRLFGDDAEYLAINVAQYAPATGPGAGWDSRWGVAYPSPWGSVWPYTGPRPEDPTTVADIWAADITAEGAAAQEAQRIADRSGLRDAEAIGEVGDPAAAILDAADEHHVDVIVVGSHERSWLSRLFSRSVAADVVKNADIPVLVAK